MSEKKKTMEEEVKYPTTSPASKPKVFDAEMSFFDALKEAVSGKRITKAEWKDKRHYGLVKDGILQIHKAGEKTELTHPWILSVGDLQGDDFIVL